MATRSAIQEISPNVDIAIQHSSARVYYVGSEAMTVAFHDVAAVSRAMNAIKESPEYAAWLTRKGLR